MALYSELITASSFVCLAFAGHKLHHWIEHHAPGHGKVAYALTLFAHPATVHTIEGYTVHFVVYSQYGLSLLLGGH